MTEVNWSVKGEGRDALLLHGWGGSIESLEELQLRLSDKGYKVYNLDLPGFGSSEKLKSVMDLADYAEFIGDFIGENKLINPVLVGHSFGGKIAAKYCIDENNKVSQLILINSSGIKPRNSLKKSIFRMLSKVGKFIFSLPLLRRAEPFAQKFLYKGLVREVDYLNADDMRETMSMVVDEHLDDELEKIQNDTLIIWGENDSYVPLWMGQRFTELIPQSKFVMVEDATHGLPLHDPAIVANQIEKFLAN